MKIVSSTRFGALAYLNCPLRAVVDACHTLRAVLFDPHWLAIFELYCSDRADARAEPAGIAGV